MDSRPARRNPLRTARRLPNRILPAREWFRGDSGGYNPRHHATSGGTPLLCPPFDRTGGKPGCPGRIGRRYRVGRTTGLRGHPGRLHPLRADAGGRRVVPPPHAARRRGRTRRHHRLQGAVLALSGRCGHRRPGRARRPRMGAARQPAGTAVGLRAPVQALRGEPRARDPPALPSGRLEGRASCCWS